MASRKSFLTLWILFTVSLLAPVILLAQGMTPVSDSITDILDKKAFIIVTGMATAITFYMRWSQRISNELIPVFMIPGGILTYIAFTEASLQNGILGFIASALSLTAVTAASGVARLMTGRRSVTVDKEDVEATKKSQDDKV